MSEKWRALEIIYVKSPEWWLACGKLTRIVAIIWLLDKKSMRRKLNQITKKKIPRTFVSIGFLEGYAFRLPLINNHFKKKSNPKLLPIKPKIYLHHWMFLLFICLSAVRSSLFEKKCVCRYEAIINSVVFKSVTKEMKLKLPN